MAPDERRRAIIDAVVPLLLEHGGDVSTRQIAEAAGIAEGTIFRVFPDKPALLLAAAEETMSPADGRAQLEAALVGVTSLRERVVVTSRRLDERAERVMLVMMALRRQWMSQAQSEGGLPAHPPGPPAFVVEANRALQEMLAEVFEPHRAELAVEPERAALLLRTLVLGSRHPGAHDADRLTPDDIADVLLDGIRAHGRTTPTGRGTDVLLRLLRAHLRPYRPQLGLVVLLQFVGTMAALYLPSLNADIIDSGVATGNTAFITRTGMVMLAVSFVQILCSAGAVYVGARTAMSFGRDVRAAVFRRVGTFSSREVHLIGAPSLITRTTNDVQQVQMLVLMTCTMMVAAPIMMVGGVLMAMREDLGLSWLLAVCVPMLFLSVGFVISRMVPGFRLMQTRIDGVNRILREQITGIRVVRAFVREPFETRPVRHRATGSSPPSR